MAGSALAPRGDGKETHLELRGEASSPARSSALLGKGPGSSQEVKSCRGPSADQPLSDGGGGPVPAAWLPLWCWRVGDGHILRQWGARGGEVLGRVHVGKAERPLRVSR